MGTTVINNFKRPESRHFAFRVIFEKSPKCPTNPSGTHVPEPTAREPAPAVSAHTRPVSSENTVSTFAVNASVRRPRYWICQAPLKYHNGTEPCDRFVRKGSGIGLGLHSWHGVWDGRSDLSLEGISEGWKDSIKLDGLPDDGLFFDAKVSF